MKDIQNKFVHQTYDIDYTLTGGLVLQGSEVKSLRINGTSINNSFCTFVKGELFVKNMEISQYKFALYPHDSHRLKKILLKKKELKRLVGHLSPKGKTLVIIKLFFNEKGLAKVILGIASRKKLEDRRKIIIEKEIRRHTCIHNY